MRALRRRQDEGERLAPRLCGDERGFVLPFAAISMVAFFGLGGLAIDLGRLYNTNTELQSFADAAALAAAAELDGGFGAQTRAILAAQNLISDTQTFGTGGADLTIDGFRFFAALPPDNADPIPTRGPIQGGTPATSDVDAVFVEVAVRQETLNLFFMPVLNAFGIGAPNQATTQAWATAGFDQYVCDITPLMICNPDEPEGNVDPLYPYEPVIGQQIRLKSQAAGSAWAPGDFGLLDATLDPDSECAKQGGEEGAAAFQCAVAAIRGITQCVSRRGVNVRPGQLGTAGTKAFNTRFDMWEGPIGKYKGKANFLPAVNVTKGMVPNNKSCNQFDAAADPAAPKPKDTVPLPRDACFATNTCKLGKIGNSSASNPNFDFNTYWHTNHDNNGDGVADVPMPPTAQRSTRYGIYLYEVANGIANKSGIGGENGNTSATPSCSSTNVPDPDRRTVVAAVVNCRANGVKGNASNVPVIEFLKLFLTEPAGYPDTNDIWTEVVDTLEPGDDDGFLHELPVLYR